MKRKKNKNRTVRTEQPEQEIQDRTARAGQQGQDSKDWETGIGQLGHDCPRLGTEQSDKGKRNRRGISIYHSLCPSIYNNSLDPVLEDDQTILHI
jgi:hypothetical protein